MILKYVTQIFWGERYEWQVSLKPKEVLELIGSKNQGSWIERLFAPGVGIRTSKRGFKASNMAIGKIPMSGNSFAHILVGRVDETQNGSKVTVRFRLMIPFFIFSLIWLGFAFILGFIGGFTIIYDAFTEKDLSRIPMALVAFAFPIAGTAFLNFCRYTSKKNEDEIIYILNDILEPHRL